MDKLTPEQKEEIMRVVREAEAQTDKLAAKAVASKYTTAIFLVVIIVAFCAGASIPLWFD